MTINNLKIALMLAITCAVLSSCKKSSNSTPTANSSQLVLSLKSDNSVTTFSLNPTNGVTLNGTGTSAANVTFTSGIANIASIRLETKKNGVAKEITTSNLTNVDLFAITPASIAAAIDTGTYKEIEVRIVLAKSATTALPVVLKGNFTSAGGAVVPLEFDFNDDAVLKFQSPDNFVVDGKTNITSILKLHLNMLLRGITSAQVDQAPRTNGVILISSTVNTAIYNKIKDNVIDSFEGEHFEHHDK